MTSIVYILCVTKLMVGSIFLEKLVFENNHYRNAKINDTIELMCLGNKELQPIKKGLNGKIPSNP